MVGDDDGVIVVPSWMAEEVLRTATEKEEVIKAKNKLIELLPRDFKVRTVLNRRGKFGRVLGHVYAVDPDGKEVNINETMIKEGYATKYFTEKE